MKRNFIHNVGVRINQNLKRPKYIQPNDKDIKLREVNVDSLANQPSQYNQIDLKQKQQSTDAISKNEFPQSKSSKFEENKQLNNQKGKAEANNSNLQDINQDSNQQLVVKIKTIPKIQCLYKDYFNRKRKELQSYLSDDKDPVISIEEMFHSSELNKVFGDYFLKQQTQQPKNTKRKTRLQKDTEIKSEGTGNFKDRKFYNLKGSKSNTHPQSINQSYQNMNQKMLNIDKNNLSQFQESYEPKQISPSKQNNIIDQNKDQLQFGRKQAAKEEFDNYNFKKLGEIIHQKQNHQRKQDETNYLNKSNQNIFEQHRMQKCNQNTTYNQYFAGANNYSLQDNKFKNQIVRDDLIIKQENEYSEGSLDLIEEEYDLQPQKQRNNNKIQTKEIQKLKDRNNLNKEKFELINKKEHYQLQQIENQEYQICQDTKLIEQSIQDQIFNKDYMRDFYNPQFDDNYLQKQNKQNLQQDNLLKQNQSNCQYLENELINQQQPQQQVFTHQQIQEQFYQLQQSIIPEQQRYNQQQLYNNLQLQQQVFNMQQQQQPAISMQFPLQISQHNLNQLKFNQDEYQQQGFNIPQQQMIQENNQQCNPYLIDSKESNELYYSNIQRQDISPISQQQQLFQQYPQSSQQKKVNIFHLISNKKRKSDHLQRAEDKCVFRQSNPRKYI
ncbi:hypothetical protein TTHERM_01044410 (macronuclear) [Tetrahymena thermophila SB210]|uniref:Uncharacterized protein n=1 Tax=Tetrahymena thermophila (strain SB210) TaxID=312017 RepID=Q22CG7_TETTS|nr:hypothetical protein TTHERM_01044410 [Tetrahymena thermophila SB210]EAR82962.2 hypothetical protein TTHERM_01044410 [Tetrahymena thermophila SB210]|eukprot:XP_001030625.2 hypothetical protein TTHERM_01044410 [Tetrahymena thermophila SB210]